MPPRRRSTLPPIDVDDLRSRLDQGKIVRVAIAQSAQFPTGTVGRVRRVGDPEVDGEEFIHVELSVNGTKDLLPFAPGDVTAPTRGAATNGAAGSAGNRASANGSAPTSGTPIGAGSPLSPPAGSTATTRTNGATVATDPVDRIVFDERGSTAPAAEAPATDAPSRPKTTRSKPAGKRRGPAVAISIGTTDAEPPQWRIEAKVGSKVVLRHGSVPPARVWELVGALGDETLTRAVGTVLEEQRRAAQSRADALAAELARVQAELADLPQPRDR